MATSSIRHNDRAEKGQASTRTILLAVDSKNSVVAELKHDALCNARYNAYGHRSAELGLDTLMGYNGEPREPQTGWYLLGNGYRAYNPVLMRFHSPDRLSPFGAGGLNPYMYCIGDPINRTDPTGHSSFRETLSTVGAITGIMLSIGGIAATVARGGLMTPLGAFAVSAGAVGVVSGAMTLHAPESRAGEMLGYLSLGLSISSMGVGLKSASPIKNKTRHKIASNQGRIKEGGPRGPTISTRSPDRTSAELEHEKLLGGTPHSGPPQPPPPPSPTLSSASSASSASVDSFNSSSSSSSSDISNVVRGVLGRRPIEVIDRNGRRQMVYPR